MLRRLYTHNFRTLVNFTIEFGEMNLLLGSNGSGKSSVLDVLHRLGHFLSGDNRRVEELFPHEDVSNREHGQVRYQQFELTMDDESGEQFRYTLKIEHSAQEKKSRIAFEELLHANQPLYRFDSSNGAVATLFRDDYTSGGEYMFDWSRSGVGALHVKPYNTKLVRFRNRVHALVVIRFNLAAVSTEAATEDDTPAQDMRNFAAWYRHVSQAQQSQAFELVSTLREILPGFEGMSLQTAGESKLLNVEFSGEQGEPVTYRFSQLSDGQKALILLYALLHCLPKSGAILCIDEPENFLALPEVQHWLDALEERVANGRMQAILISHHPRLINLLAGSAGQWFYKDGASSPTRIKPVTMDENDGLPASKLVEMGWLVDE